MVVRGRPILVLALLVVASATPAQEQSAGRATTFGLIIYADGREFSVIRDGRQAVYDLAADGAVGLPVYQGDTLQTGPASYLEIQLLPSRSVVKVAENTIFTVAGLSSDGTGTLDLTYGRLRARIAQLSGEAQFQIRAVGAVAGVRGTDFGFDRVAQQTVAGLSEAVYCFDGEIEVELRGESASGAAQPLLVKANEMVNVARRDAGAKAELVRVAVSAGIRQFWTAREFVEEPLEPSDVLDRFPLLAERVTATLGTVPEFLASAPSVRKPAVTAIDRTTRAGAAGDDSSGAAEAVGGPEGRSGFGTALQVTGYVLSGGGLLADLGAIGLYFLGPTLVPGWDAAVTEPILTWVVLGGSGAFVTGIFALLLGLSL